MTVADFEDALEDAAAEAAFLRSQGTEAVPVEIVDRLLAGDSPIRVWREHRGYSLSELAAKTVVGEDFLAQLEQGTRRVSPATLAKLAAALAVDIDDLT